MRLDLHSHSKYSPDSWIEPARLERILEKRGMDGMAVTDHSSIKGGMAIKKLFKSKIAIPGVEYRTEIGDVIGLFIQEEIRSRNFEEVLDEFKDQDAISILPHPFDSMRKPVPPECAKHVQCIEVLNPRCHSTKLNEKALELANKFGKTHTGGSDAHFYYEVGRAWTEIEGSGGGGPGGEGSGIEGDSEDIRKALLSGNTKVDGKMTLPLIRPCSWVVKIFKRIGSRE